MSRHIACMLCLCSFYAREYQVNRCGEIFTHCIWWRVNCSLVAFTIFTCVSCVFMCVCGQVCVCVWCVCVCVCVFSEVYQVDKITHLKSRSLNSRLCLHLKWSWLTCFDKNAFHSQCLCTVHVNYHILNEIDRISNFMQWNP